MLSWLNKKVPSHLSGSFWSLFDVALYPALYFLFTPQLAKNFGLELFGVWCFINTTIVFLQILNFGLGTNTQRNIAKAVSTGNHEAAGKLLDTNLSFSLLLTVLSGGATIVVAIAQYQTNLLDVSQSRLYSTCSAIMLCGFVAGLKIIEQVIVNTIIALGKLRISSLYNSIVRISVLGIAIVVARSRDKQIALILATQIAIILIGLSVLYHFIKHRISGYRFQFKYDLTLFKKELSESRQIWYQSILVILAFQCDKLWIAASIGVKEFSFYATSSTIFNHLHLAIMALTPFALTELSKKSALRQDISSYYFSLRSLTLIASFAGFSLLHFVWQPLFHIWIGSAFSDGLSKYINLFIVFELNLVFTIGPFHLLNAVGKLRLAVVNTAIFSGLSIAGSVFGYLATHSGTGVLLGCSIGLWIAVLVQQYLVARSFGWNLFRETFMLPFPFLCFNIYCLTYEHFPYQAVCALAVAVLSFSYTFFILYPVSFTLVFPKNHAAS